MIKERETGRLPSKTSREKFSPYTIKNAGGTGKGKGKGKGRIHSCSFKMCCLSSPLDTHVPSTVSYKKTL